MHELLHFQFRRLYKRATPYIFLSILLALILMETPSLLISNEYYDLSSPYKHEPYIYLTLDESFYTLDRFVSLLIAVFVGIFVTEDRVNGTIKNIYSKGYSRVKIFFSKYLATISIPILFYLLIFISGSLIGFINAAGTQPNSQLFWINNDYIFELIIIFLKYMVITTLFYMLSELVSSTGGAIALNIFAPVIIAVICFLLSPLIYTQSFMACILCILSSFMPMHLISSFTMIADRVIISVVMILLFGGLSLLITVKKQIKN